MLDFELHDKFKVRIKIPQAEFNVNDLVSCCKSLSKSLVQSFFEKILYELQAHILNHYLGAVWNSNNSIPTPWECPRCRNRIAFNRRGKRKRSLKSSVGILCFHLLQVTCLDCEKTFSPFPLLLGIESRHRLTKELEQFLCTVVKDNSYSKTAKAFNLLLGLDLSPTTVHRTVQKHGQEVEVIEDLSQITHLQTDITRINASANERGISVHFAISVGGSYQKGKRTIRQKTLACVQVAKSPEKIKTLLDRSKIDQITVDGLSGLEGYISKNQLPVNVQRCLWHIPRTAKHMLYLDGMSTPQAREFVKPMNELLFNESLSVDRRVKKYNKLIEKCKVYNLTSTNSFLENAKEHLFTYKQFAEKDLHGRTNSVIERQMREVNRRMENGSRWTEKGAQNLLNLKFIEELNPESYDYLWKLRKKHKSEFSVILC
jgi:hypothetical protein